MAEAGLDYESEEEVPVVGASSKSKKRGLQKDKKQPATKRANVGKGKEPVVASDDSDDSDDDSPVENTDAEDDEVETDGAGKEAHAEPSVEAEGTGYDTDTPLQVVVSRF